MLQDPLQRMHPQAVLQKVQQARAAPLITLPSEGLHLPVLQDAQQINLPPGQTRNCLGRACSCAALAGSCCAQCSPVCGREWPCSMSTDQRLHGKHCAARSSGPAACRPTWRVQASQVLMAPSLWS